MFKIIGGDGKEYGPVSADKLREWIRQGRVNTSTRVCAVGSADWVELRSLPEFSAEFAPATAPAPAMAASAPTVAPGEGKLSRMAIFSVVLGVIGFLGVTGLAGLILGIVSLVKINGSLGRLRGKGVAVTGIVLNGIMLLLIVPLVVMAGLLLPALAQAKSKAQTINCVNNLKQLSIAIKIYSRDNNDKFPSAANWCDAINTTVGSPRVFQCPDNLSLRCAYAYNKKVSGMEEGKVDPQTVVLFESNLGWNGAGGPNDVAMRHRRQSNQLVIVGFADGSVQQIPASRLSTLRWEP
jgi:hypothetical protein